jgi:signal transduction histidine kinase
MGFVAWSANEIAADSFINHHLLQEKQKLIHQSRHRHTPLSVDSEFFRLFAFDALDKPNYLHQADSLGIQEFELHKAHVLTFVSPMDQRWYQLEYLPQRDPGRVDYNDGVYRYVIYMMLLVLGTGLVVAFFLSRYFSKPIMVLASQVQAMPGATCQLPPAWRHDEIGTLHHAFSESFDRIQGFLRREQQFTRFASHELRTPVHIIQGAVELLTLKETDSKKKQALLRIQRANNEMDQLINTFLLIGREQRQTQPCGSLTTIIKYHIEQQATLLRQRHIEYRLTLQSDRQVESYFANIVCANLIRNAFSYAGKHVEVYVRGNRLVIQNDVCSERAQGHGFGTEIIYTVCNSANWRFFSRVTPYKATVVLYL